MSAQLAPASHRPGRLKVTQIKSKISERPNQRETLRSLGLKRIGDVVVREDNSQNRGYVRTVAHLVKVEEIDGPEGLAVVAETVTQVVTRNVVEAEVQAPHGGDEMSELERKLSTQTDGVQVFDHGEFIEWHKQDGLRSLVWSLDLSVSALVKQLQSLLGEPDEDRLGLVRQRGDTNLIIVTDGASDPHVSAREAVEIVTNDEQNIGFLWLDFGQGRTLAWAPSVDTERPANQKNPGEASLSFSPEDREMVEIAVRSTATKRIGELAAKIVERVAA